MTGCFEALVQAFVFGDGVNARQQLVKEAFGRPLWVHALDRPVAQRLDRIENPIQVRLVGISGRIDLCAHHDVAAERHKGAESQIGNRLVAHNGDGHVAL